MLGSIKRVIKVNWIDKTKLNFTSSVVMAGEMGDSIVITKSNHIELYGNIFNINE